ncbi:nucleoside deaminase [Caldichromatium japonicum]|uniref:Nucleoside deaminase n=1 Tax=Caldichromatium japonicum TaxID=2699430 RepID=A0A6G7VD00_9GAMM|nr:nucleoside deaminase [Caldichromatium japonicum]QIK37929.1 nucleoside deaminase [Caldichromatium japonicum]
MYEIRIALPDWVDGFLAAYQLYPTDDEGRMQLVLALARENIRAGTGGPFAAAVFGRGDGRLIAIGVNRVVASRCSLAHAEMVAIGLAQQQLGHYDLAAAAPGGCVLYTSAEPCAMCMGAIPWAGLQRVVIAARDMDARAAGFDEGDKPQDWLAAYARRGIEVVSDLLRAEAAAVLAHYARLGGEIYGPRADP